jgi:hypothetical protein
MYTLLKGTASRDFRTKIFFHKTSVLSPDLGAKAFSNINSHTWCACVIIDTACKIKFSKFFVSENQMRNGFAMQKMDNLQKIRAACQPIKGISIKNILCTWIVLQQNYINLRVLSSKKKFLQVCHWPNIHENRPLKCWISSRMRSRIKKGFIPWIWEDCLMKKTEGQRSVHALKMRNLGYMRIQYQKSIFVHVQIFFRK